MKLKIAPISGHAGGCNTEKLLSSPDQDKSSTNESLNQDITTLLGVSSPSRNIK